MNKTKFILSGVALAVLVAGATGCATKMYDKSAATSSASQAAASQLTVVSTKINDAIGALDNLTSQSQGDLRPPYDNYVASVKDLQTATGDLDKKVAAVQSQAGGYLNSWSNSLPTITNASIRAMSAARYSTVNNTLQSVNAGYNSVKASLKPFTADLTDIQTALGADLTANGLASVQSAVAKTKSDAAPLRDAIKNLQSGFSQFSSALSPVRTE